MLSGRSSRAGWSLAGCGAALLVAAAPLQGQQAEATDLPPVRASVAGSQARTAAVQQVTVAPRVDGVLDEEAWEQAAVLGGFVQRLPQDGAPASEPTEVRVLFDDRAVYVGVWLWDSNPAGIVAGERVRDANLNDSDAVVLIFDTYRDQQNAFVFGTNPNGIEYDGQLSNEGEGSGSLRAGMRQQGGAGGGFNVNWDGAWEVATSRDERGWYAEFRIPFSTLRYGPAEVQEWGFNAMRRIRRHNEESLWSPVPRQFSTYRLSYAGTLSGVRPPTRRLTTVTPYVLGSAARNYQAGDPGFRYPAEFGADAKVQLTQGLTLDLTYNTDFAQVEVDDAQINLTRFSLQFPEKRPFFLENAGFFAVGGGEAQLFFSRQVGIAQGAQVPIRGGGRLSGRVEGFNVGLLHIQTGHAEGLQPATGYSVARIARELPNRSRIGALVTSRDVLDARDDHGRTYALDGQWGLGEAFTLNGFVARTETTARGVDHAVDLGGAFQTRDWRATLDYRMVGDDFRPEMGFLPRAGYHYYRAYAHRAVRPEGISWIRESRPHVSYTTYRDRGTGFEESSQIHIDLLSSDFPGGGYISPHVNWVREGLQRPFLISPGVVVQPGTYDGFEAVLAGSTNPAAPVSVDTRITVGDFLSGSRAGGSAGLTLRQSSLTTSLRLTHHDIRLAEGEFSTTLLGLRAGYFFTPRVYLQSLVQYSDQLDAWSANLRFGWLGTGGTGLFVVYNEAQGWGMLEGPLNRSLIVKFTRQFNVHGS
jgi:hypothetical protein